MQKELKGELLSKKPKAQHDSAWKDVLDEYLPQALEICFPDLYQLIDWDRGWAAQDKELETISKEDKIGKQFVDKLIRVFLKDGSAPWVLLHLEVEQAPTAKFPERMFVYAIRLFNKYGRPIASCAFLADDNSNYRPTSYEVGFGGSRLRQDFLVCKLIDFEKDRETLETSTNPFATVILFHLDALKAKKQPEEQKYETKVGLCKRMIKNGFKRNEIVNFLRFLDFSIALTEEFELKYREEIHQFEANKHMTYLSNFELISMQRGFEKGVHEGIEKGMEKGIARGIEKERNEVALNLLREGLDVNLIAKVTGLTPERLQELQKQAH